MADALNTATGTLTQGQPNLGLALSNVAKQMLGQNQRVTQGLQEAAKTQLRQQMGGQGPMGIQQVQQVGQQAAGAAGQAALQGMAQGAQQQSEVGKLALNQQSQENQLRLQSRQLDLERQTRLNTQRLSDLDSTLKSRLVDDQFQFQKDDLGRTMFNERQLMDYKLQTAKSNLDLQAYEDKVRQLSERRMALLKAAEAKITQELTNQYQLGAQRGDQATKEKLIRAKYELDRKKAQAEADAKNRANMFEAVGSTIGTVVGATAAAIIATPGGPAAMAAAAAAGGNAGAQAGRGLGDIAYSSGIFD